MTTDSMRKKIFDYVEERRCREGRFCFYKLEEPNGSDTYYALSILDWLGVPQEDPRTVNYLQEMQHSDGSYDSVFAAFYSLKGLRLLNADPLADPLPASGHDGYLSLKFHVLPSLINLFMYSLEWLIPGNHISHIGARRQ
jgi:hypothetical protein